MMKSAIILTVFGVVFALAEIPPIPYAENSVSSSASFPNDRIQTVGEQYINHYGNDGFNIQSEYDDYLIPAVENGLLSFADGIRNLSAFGWKVLPKIVTGAAVLLTLFLIGGCINTLICSLTSLCTISFAGHGLTKDAMRSYFTPDRVTSTANFVINAIKKYRNMYESYADEVDGDKKVK
ncbi:hypothetical protein Phum_PHUM351580 [Pediculus humanus corporis]|uniref:Uncharacterized protein n=1 Tax=Pediculus humanus subsp. corporis TaxID=121224 RepID=E0VP41_PEDHC|nr:uncharacterized protein Phum_PHUM351580 [Pediculus humanus corporis]EEB15147.1 hypothetical protein Phum_PHUM351580 [Pediculus humanus corporis]